MLFKEKLVVVAPTMGGSNWLRRVDEVKSALKESMPSTSLGLSLLMRTVGHTLGYFIWKDSGKEVGMVLFFLESKKS